MSSYTSLLLLALLPAAGTALGALVAEVTRVPGWVIGAALHMAAGIAIALVSVDLMPRVLGMLPMWLLVLAFSAGAICSVLLWRVVRILRRHLSSEGSRGAWMVYAAVGADLLSDGLMIGAGSAVSTGLGLLLGVSQVVGNLPGGFAAMANFRDDGVPRSRRLKIAASFGLPVLLGANVGYWLLRGAGDWLENGALTFIVGVLLLATVEDLVPEADAPAAPRWITTAAFAGGFVFLVLLSVGLGGGGLAGTS